MDDNKKELKENKLEKVTGGDVTSANVVGYGNIDCDHQWTCPENIDPNKPYTQFDGNIDGNGHSIK